jgi:hypothetical protein
VVLGLPCKFELQLSLLLLLVLLLLLFLLLVKNRQTQQHLPALFARALENALRSDPLS